MHEAQQKKQKQFFSQEEDTYRSEVRRFHRDNPVCHRNALSPIRKYHLRNENRPVGTTLNIKHIKSHFKATVPLTGQNYF